MKTTKNYYGFSERQIEYFNRGSHKALKAPKSPAIISKASKTPKKKNNEFKQTLDSIKYYSACLMLMYVLINGIHIIHFIAKYI